MTDPLLRVALAYPAAGADTPVRPLWPPSLGSFLPYTSLLSALSWVTVKFVAQKKKKIILSTDPIEWNGAESDREFANNLTTIFLRKMINNLNHVLRWIIEWKPLMISAQNWSTVIN